MRRPGGLFLALVAASLLALAPGPARADPGPLLGQDPADGALNPTRYASEQVEGAFVEVLYQFAQDVMLNLYYEPDGQGGARPRYVLNQGAMATAPGDNELQRRVREFIRRAGGADPTAVELVYRTPQEFTYNHPFVGYWQTQVRLFAWGLLGFLVAYAAVRFLLARLSGRPYPLFSVALRFIVVGVFVGGINLVGATVIELGNDLSWFWKGDGIFLGAIGGSRFRAEDLFGLYNPKQWQEARLTDSTLARRPDLSEAEKTLVRQPRWRLEHVLALDFYVFCAALYVLLQFVRLLALDVLLIVCPLAALFTALPGTRRIAGLWGTSFIGLALAQPFQVAVLAFGANLILMPADGRPVFTAMPTFLLGGAVMLCALAAPLAAQRLAQENIQKATAGLAANLLGAKEIEKLVAESTQRLANQIHALGHRGVR